MHNNAQAGYIARAFNLAPGEGLTFAVGFSKGVIAQAEKPWAEAEALGYIDFAPAVVPVFVLIGMVYLWYTRGRDPEGRKTIVTQFEPPDGVLPGIAGIVYNERIEPRELSAEIVRLAVEGYLTIHRIEKEVFFTTTTDYLFERKNDAVPGDPIGQLILEKVFDEQYAGEEVVHGRTVHGTLVSKMKHKFVTARDVINDTLYDSMYTNGYFVERPDVVRKKFVGSGTVLAILGIVGAVFAPWGVYAISAVAGIVSGVFVAIVGIWMPARTRAGVLLKEHLEGFKRYLSVAEGDRLAFHNAPEKKPELFDHYLPYAMVFGVENAWAEQFKDIYTAEPTWHTGDSGMFSAASLVSGIQTFSTDIAAASMPQSSGSSGGGSVGGGFGGGGGGSW